MQRCYSGVDADEYDSGKPTFDESNWQGPECHVLTRWSYIEDDWLVDLAKHQTMAVESTRVAQRRWHLVALVDLAYLP